MTTFTYKSTTGLAVNIDKYTITVNPGLQFSEPISILDRYVGAGLARYTDGVLDQTDGEDSQLITASQNVTRSHTDDLIKANHASVPIVLTILNDTLGSFTGTLTLATLQYGVAAVSFVAGSGVTLRGSAPTIAQYGIISVIRIGTNEWAYLV